MVEIRFNLTKYGPTIVINQNLVESKLFQCNFNSLGPSVCYDQVSVQMTFGSPRGTLISQSSEMLELLVTNPTVGIIYYELWNPLANTWQVWPMLPFWWAINANLNPTYPYSLL